MLEYRTISHFNPRPRPTCDSPDNSSGPRKPWKKCVLYTHTFNEERFKWDLFVLLILSCLHVSVVKNNYIKRLAASLFLASIFHATYPKTMSPVCTAYYYSRPISIYGFPSLKYIQRGRPLIFCGLWNATPYLRSRPVSPQHSYN